jgi:hypothetical protein
VLGFLTGDKGKVIPWGSIMKDQTSWIMEECIPDEFQWKDPSKIQREEVYRLLDHWRARQDNGLEPLIWVPTCPLFKDSEKTAKRHCNLLQSLMRKCLSFQIVMILIWMKVTRVIMMIQGNHPNIMIHLMIVSLQIMMFQWTIWMR